MRSRKKKKVLVITGTRAEYGLLRPVIREIRKSKVLTLRLLVTGMHTQKKYGKTIDLIKKDHIPISSVVPIGQNDSMLMALSKEIVGIEKYCLKERPDVLLVDADRGEGFAGALVAGHLCIPLAHMGGGDTSGFGVDEPIRHSITKFAHVHFPISVESAKRIQRLGEEAWRIHMVGTTAFEEALSTRLPDRKQLAKRLRLDANLPWILFTQHPTPLDSTPVSQQIVPSLKALKNVRAEKILIYPNSDTGADIVIRSIEALRGERQVHIYASFPRNVYLALLKESDIVVGNSSSGIVEAGFFHKPVVDIGNRQKGREHGRNVIHVPYDEQKISRAITTGLSGAFKKTYKSMTHPYGGGTASRKIVRILENLRLDEKLMYKQIPL
ncbi:MAG: UDP-N-acetylglucosamine 2-epimerase [Patescibacteria group bacterium]